jgi:(1->4)-alpha-D-glucan 1-alpha-D-glucosylmutase
LVDPDNRVPLDASRHEQSLASLPDVATGDLLAGWRDGRVKQFVLRRLLETRRASPALFAVGDYQPLTVTGEASDHVLAFARSDGDGWAVVVVPRLVQSLVGPGEFPVDATCWTNTEVVLPLRCVRPLTDVLSQREFAAPAGRLPLSQLFDVLPLAVLVAGN